MPWNITRIYPSFESTEYKRDWETLVKKIEEAKAWADTLPAQKDPLSVMERYIMSKQTLQELVSRLSSFSQLQLASDVQNEEARKEMEKLQKTLEALTVPEVRFTRWLKEQDLSSIKDSATLSPYLWDLSQIQKEAKHLLPEREEELLEKLKKTGSRAWSKLQQSITSLAMGTIKDEKGEEKKLPLMSIRNLAFHDDKQIRKQAFESENKLYENLEEPAAAALNHIKGEMLTEAEWRGYVNPWELISDRHRINHKTVLSVMESVKAKLPLLQSFYEIKAQYLGYDRLPYWELYAPLGKITRTYPIEEARKIILHVFSQFDPLMAEMADRAFSDGWLDIEPRMGKRGGAFCSGLYTLKESRILLNHENTLENLITLAHELGHAYHNIWLMKESILHSGSPLSLAETASTFNEHLLQDYLMEDMTESERLPFLEKKIHRGITVIVDIYSRFRFEQAVMDLREQSTLSVRKLKELMKEAQMEAYGNGLDASICQPNAWINKPHYYMPGLHFYNFPYTIGNLISTYLFTRSQKEGPSFLPLYQKLLGTCGKGTVEEILDTVGIALDSDEFMEISFAGIEKDIQQFQELASSR